MNPWAVVLALLAIGCLIVATKGTQDNVISAVLGRQYSGSTLIPSSGTTAATVQYNPNTNPAYATLPALGGQTA